MHALEALAANPTKTQQEAADEAGINRATLCRALQKEHVHSYLALAAKRHIARHYLRAAHVKSALLAAESEKVRNDVASDILAIGGIAPPSGRGAGVNVSVGVQVGYVVNWQPPEPAVDVTPEASKPA
jgi:heterodisulfide reductase subunit A-like polyferredoxin